MDAATLDDILPKRLHILRKATGLSAAALDRKAQFSAGTTGRLERGDQRIYARHLYCIARVLGISIEQFYAGANTPAAPEFKGANADGTHRFEHEKQQFLQAYLTISDPVLKRNIFEMIEALAHDEDQKTVHP